MHAAQPLFPTHPYVQRRWDALERQQAFRCQTIEAWQQWQPALRRTLRNLIGYDTMVRTALNPEVTEACEYNEYIRQRVEIQTEPGIIMPMYVLIPKHGTPPYPVVLAPPGHQGGGKYSVAGRRDIPEIAAAIDKFNYDYGVQFAKAGCMTFCPDARGFGERRELADADNILAASCRLLNNMALPLGQTVVGMQTWDLHRLIDYVYTRSDCRTEQIGCAGFSGGGLQTLWAAALDERITCAVISGYLYGYKESLLDLHGNCSCNYVPHLWEYVDMADIACLIAPRPLLVESASRDHLNGMNGLQNVRSQIEIVSRAYRLLDVETHLRYVEFEGEHQWHGVEAIPWMMQQLRLKDDG